MHWLEQAKSFHLWTLSSCPLLVAAFSQVIWSINCCMISQTATRLKRTKWLIIGLFTKSKSWSKRNLSRGSNLVRFFQSWALSGQIWQNDSRSRLYVIHEFFKRKGKQVKKKEPLTDGERIHYGFEGPFRDWQKFRSSRQLFITFFWIKSCQSSQN